MVLTPVQKKEKDQIDLLMIQEIAETGRIEGLAYLWVVSKMRELASGKDVTDVFHGVRRELRQQGTVTKSIKSALKCEKYRRESEASDTRKTPLDPDIFEQVSKEISEELGEKRDYGTIKEDWKSWGEYLKKLPHVTD